jgi:hypothetical protein
VDTEYSYDTYTGSIGQYATTTRDATMYNNGSTGLFTAGDHAYLLVNCGIVSLLDTKALGGLTFRVTGATATDWAEFELFGSDEWPSAFDGGWIQIVVDIDELLANPTNTNGTAPTVGNIQRCGVTFITATVMPRMTDNIWVGGFKRLAAGNPAIIVEGRDGGTTDWAWSTIASNTNVLLSAVLRPGPGGSYVCRGPFQFGINDTSTHAFTDTNKTLLWDFQEVMLDGFYTLTALGNSGGTTNFTLGVKTGTGDDATGAQGGSIQAASNGARWDMDFNDPNVDGVNFYGVQCIHGGDFLLDDPAVSCISTSYIDCTSALVSNSEQLRVQVIDPNVTAGVAFMTTDDLTDIVFSFFQSSGAGHAVELTTPRVASQTNKGNDYVSYDVADPGTANNKGVYNNSGGAVTISTVSGGSNMTQDYQVRNGASASTTVTANTNVTFDKLKDNTEVRVFTAGTETEVAGIEDATAGTADDRNFQWSTSAGASVDYQLINKNYVIVRVEGYTVPADDITIDFQQRLDLNV